MSYTILDPRFADLIDAEAGVARPGTGFIFTEGPIWHPLENHLLFSDMPGDVRRKWTLDGAISEAMRPSNKGNGMTYDRDLDLLVCEHATSSVARFRPDGTREVLCSHFEGRELNSPNDICIRSDGTVYFTDPTYGRLEHFGVPRPVEQGFQGVYLMRPGHSPGDEPLLTCDRDLFGQPNGLCFSPDERLMYVNDTEQTNIRVFEVMPDGGLANGRVFADGIADADLPGVPDGMKCDTQGNIWVTAPGGVWVYGPDGVLLGKIAVPEVVANLHWGGEDWGTLFLCASTSLYAVRTRARPRVEPFMYRRQPTEAAPAADAAAGLVIDPARTALIIQDMQNDVIMDGGANADSGAPDHAREQNVIANSVRLAEACRKAGIMVLHVWFVCEPGFPAQPLNAPLFRGLKEADANVRGTWGVAPVAGLEPKAGDLVVEKMTMSAWPSSRLESYLAGARIDTIINTGAWTNMSVEHTARTAADKGYRVIVPEDACSTMNADWQRASIEYAMANVAEITTVSEVVAALEKGRS